MTMQMVTVQTSRTGVVFFNIGLKKCIPLPTGQEPRVCAGEGGVVRFCS